MFKSREHLPGSFHLVIWGLSLEPIASALGSKDLGEVDSDLHLVLTSGVQASGLL